MCQSSEMGTGEADGVNRHKCMSYPSESLADITATSRKGGIMKTMIGTMLLASVLVCFFGFGQALAEMTWADDIANSLAFSKTNYPTSNWEPYSQKLGLVQDALHRGDQRTIKAEMSKWFKMLRARAHGISDVAADELFNFSLMVTPIQEYGISVPAPAGGISELVY